MVNTVALVTLPISYQRPSGPLKASPARALALKAVSLPVTVSELRTTETVPVEYQGMTFSR